MRKIIFSLLVHESPDSLLDQLNNFFYYNPDSYVVIHLAKNIWNDHMLLEKFKSIISEYTNVQINPNCVRTGFADIIQAHISNFQFVKDSDFEYFVFSSSNELFVKKNMYEDITHYDCGLNFKSIKKWYYKKTALGDKVLLNFAKGNSNNIKYSQIEGTFYKKEMLAKIIEIISINYNYEKETIFYPREEVYFSTVCYNFIEQYNAHVPITYMKFEGKEIFVSFHKIKKIRNKDLGFYSVKRVDRQLNNYLRDYIRKLSGLERIVYEKIKKYGYSYKETSKIKMHYLNFSKNIKFFIRTILRTIYYLIRT